MGRIDVDNAEAHNAELTAEYQPMLVRDIVVCGPTSGAPGFALWAFERSGADGQAVVQLATQPDGIVREDDPSFVLIFTLRWVAEEPDVGLAAGYQVVDWAPPVPGIVIETIQELVQKDCPDFETAKLDALGAF